MTQQILCSTLKNSFYLPAWYMKLLHHEQNFPRIWKLIPIEILIYFISKYRICEHLIKKHHHIYFHKTKSFRITHIFRPRKRIIKEKSTKNTTNFRSTHEQKQHSKPPTFDFAVKKEPKPRRKNAIKKQNCCILCT